MDTLNGNAVEVTFPSYWREIDACNNSFIGFHSTEASTKVVYSAYCAFVSVSKPSKTDLQEAATGKMIQITEDDFWKHYNAAKRRIERFEPRHA